MDKKLCNTAMGRASEALRKQGVTKKEFNNDLKDFYLHGGTDLKAYLQGKYKLTNQLAKELTQTVQERIGQRLKVEQANRLKTFKDLLNTSESGKILNAQTINKIAKNLSDPKTGILSYTNLQTAIARELKQKIYSPKTEKRLIELSQKYEKLENEITKTKDDSEYFGKRQDLIFEQQLIDGEIEQLIATIEKPSISQYLEDVRYNTNLLASADTMTTNIAGAFSMNPLKIAQLALEVGFGDKQSKQIALGAWKRAKKLTQTIWEREVFIDSIKTQKLHTEGKNAVSVPLPVLREVSKAVKAGMAVPDYLIFDVAFNQSLLRDMRAENVKTPTLEMLEIAEQEALMAVGRDKDVFLGTNGAELLHKVVSSIDELGSKLPEVTIGGRKIDLRPKLGNKLFPFTNMVGNQMGKQLTGGIVRGTWEAIQLPFIYKNLTPAQVRQRWRRIHEGIGDAGALGVVALAYQAGAIVPMALNFEEERTMQSTGQREGTVKVGKDKYFDLFKMTTPFDFKAKALMRFMEATKRIHDLEKYITDPKTKDIKKKEIWSKTLLRISQDPIITQLSRSIQEAGFDFKGEKSSEGLAEEIFYKAVDSVAQQIGQYIPLNRQLKNISNLAINRDWDFKVVESYDPDPLRRTWNKFLAGYGVGDTRASVTGKDLERLYTLNLVSISKDKEDKAAKELLKVQRESGEGILDPMPRKVEGKKLSAEEWKKGNQIMGKIRGYFIGELSERPEYKLLSPLDKAFILDQTEKASAGLALLGSVGKPLPKRSVAGRLARIVQSDLSKADKSRAISGLLMKQLQKSKHPKADKTKKYEIEEIQEIEVK